MVVVSAFWTLAMVAGLCWARWVVSVLAGVTVVLAIAVQPTLVMNPVGWFLLLVLGISPWLLAAERARHEEQVQHAQTIESVQLNRLQEQTQQLVLVHGSNEQLESQIGQITALYHVTKEIARAMHGEELFAFSLEVVPRLLDIKGARLIELSRPADGPFVFRAVRQADGQLLAGDPAAALLPAEHAIVERVTSSGAVGVASAAELRAELPAGLTRMAWAPLWAEDRLIGVLIADELPTEQLSTLSIVANQVSLQLARVHFYQAIEAMAITDTLTGLFVRRYFQGLAEEELSRSAHHKLPCTVVMADLDLFKSKNDQYGHLVGDVVLREVAQLIKQNLREIDLIARYGGEEFILLLVETGPEQAMQIAERIRQLVARHPIRAYDEVLTQTVSMGVASFPDDGKALRDLIEHSDQALYAAKRAGRNRVHRWQAKRQ